MNDPNEVEQTESTGTEQEQTQTETPAPATEVIPKARLDEVIGERNSLREQMAAAQQAIYESQLQIQRLNAEQEAFKKLQAQAPATQNLTPEQAQKKAAQDQLKQMLAEAAGPVINERLSAFERNLAPIQELVENSQRATFWAEPKNAKLPEKLKQMTEVAYNQGKRTMPGLTREVALQFAKGAFYDEQISAAESSTETKKNAVNAVNRVAATSPTGSGAAGRTEAPAPKSKKAADLDAELRELAERGYK